MIGLEKFSHLEDKIYRLIEVCNAQRRQIEQLEKDLAAAREETSMLMEEKGRVGEQYDRLMSERDEIRTKVEAMLDAIAVIDPELADSARK